MDSNSSSQSQMSTCPSDASCGAEPSAQAHSGSGRICRTPEALAAHLGALKEMHGKRAWDLSAKRKKADAMYELGLSHAYGLARIEVEYMGRLLTTRTANTHPSERPKGDPERGDAPGMNQDLQTGETE